VLVGTSGYLLSDRNDIVRSDIIDRETDSSFLKSDETKILHLASLAPSGHNTQPWIIKYLGPHHWIIASDSSRWLPAVDPTQRETILSLGAFVQNLEYAALNEGYYTNFKMLATSCQDEDIAEVKLVKESVPSFDISKIRLRRTVRSGYLNDLLRTEDLHHITGIEKDYWHFIPRGTSEYRWINEQTIEANRIQVNRDAAQAELSEWIRFSRADVKQHLDGLTTAGMEIRGIPAWIVRNFYNRDKVMSSSFRNQSLDKVKEQVAQSAGWLLLTSKSNSVVDLMEAGKRFERMLLRIRERKVAVHPMTQILEEPETKLAFYSKLRLTGEIQFILRLGYLDAYPDPVSVRRPVDSFVNII